MKCRPKNHSTPERGIPLKQHNADLLGAIVAHVIFCSSILTFVARLTVGVKPGHWIGIPLLLMVFPLAYLLITAPSLHRAPIYYIQISVMILSIVVLFILDYMLKYDFRQTSWMVISFVVLYFAGMGGMLGIISLAGSRWVMSGVILFFIAAVLAFVQRAITGY